MAFFFGPIFIHPEETDHEPTKMFYKREVFLTHLEETLPMTCVLGAVSFLFLVWLLRGLNLKLSSLSSLTCILSHACSCRQMCGVVLQGLCVLQTHWVLRRGCPAVRESLHRYREANEKVQGSETFLILSQSGGGWDTLFQVGLWQQIDHQKLQTLTLWAAILWLFYRKSIAPQKEASPLLDKKIDELEAKLADLEDADDDMDDLDDEDDAPETPSMPQMQTPLSSDMDMMHYMPSQVPIRLPTCQFPQNYWFKNVNKH